MITGRVGRREREHVRSNQFVSTPDALLVAVATPTTNTLPAVVPFEHAKIYHWGVTITGAGTNPHSTASLVMRGQTTSLAENVRILSTNVRDDVFFGWGPAFPQNFPRPGPVGELLQVRTVYDSAPVSGTTWYWWITWLM